MQCAACRAVYSNALEFCPRCKRAASSAPAPTAEKRSSGADKRTSASMARRDGRPATPPTAEASERVATETPGVSTLIEFPGTGRNARPQWRKELSERVREIQSRRARESALEAEAAARRQNGHHGVDENDAVSHTPSTDGQNAPPLGLVPPTEMPEMNPLVVAALRRIERARQMPPPMPRGSRGAAAAAVARVAEEQYEPSPVAENMAEAMTEIERAPALRSQNGQVSLANLLDTSEALQREKTAEAARPSGLVVISNAQANKPEATTNTTQDEPLKISASVEQALTAEASKTESAVKAQETGATFKTEEGRVVPEVAASGHCPAENKAEASRQPPRRLMTGVIDDSWLTRLDAEILPPVVSARDIFDDGAPLATRFAGAAVDILLVAFLSSPFAAIIELTSGNWSDPRVAASMSGIVSVIMFLYLTGSTALAGRTLGMKLFSMHIVDAESALSPTTGQSVRRALVYMLSLVTFGLGILYALFDAEGRTAHDHLSGTIVVRE